MSLSEMSMIAKAALRDPAERRGGEEEEEFFYIRLPYVFGLLSLHICFSFVIWEFTKILEPRC